MLDPATPPATRVRAADRHSGPHDQGAIETEDIDARVAALEQAAELSKIAAMGDTDVESLVNLFARAVRGGSSTLN